MLATPNSASAIPWSIRRLGRQARRPAFLNGCWRAACVWLLAAGIPAAAQTNPTPGLKADFAARARQTFEAARARSTADTNDLAAALQFARASYDWADYATKDSQKAAIAQQGIESCRRIIKMTNSSAPGHYYLGMNLGQLADARRGLEGL